MRQWATALALGLGLFLCVRIFLIEAFRIPTASMEHTLQAGDFLLVNKAVFGAHVPFTDMLLPAFAEPVHGDVVVFQPRHDPQHNYVKRIVGVPGDTLAMRGKLLYRNHEPLAEPYAQFSDPLDAYGDGMLWQCSHAPAVTARRERCRPTRDNWGPLVVPPAHFFVLGDNRDASEDSRFWGFVPRRALRGQPLVIYFSWDAGDAPRPWRQRIRGERIGQRVH